jgi:hypothetical protein
MTETSLKPRGNEVHELLKLLKVRFDDRNLAFYEPTLYRQAMLSDEPMFASWRGEILHQLALRAERRGDVARAMSLYGYSSEAFRDSASLGRARQTRDFGMMMCREGEPEKGWRLIQEALELHEGDRHNAKGERQRRITQGYELRAQVMAGQKVEQALDQLTELALAGSLDFCLRDQFFVVEFVRRYTSGDARRAMDMRRVDIMASRGQLAGTVTSIVRMMIDTEVTFAGKLVGRFLG